MAFFRPTLERLVARAQADVESLLENGASRVRRSVEWVLSRVTAGLAYGLYGHQEWISKQIIPDTAEDEFLVRWASLWGVERNSATQAELEILVTGVEDAEMLAGTVWQSASGVQYATDADLTMPAEGEVAVAVTATLAGAAGNVVAGSTLSLTSPVAGIDSDATVNGSGAVGGGSDQETIDSLRARLLARVQTPPSGGGPGDYVDWAKEVDGVTRAWELPQQLGPGTVLVLFVQDTFDDDGNFESTTFPAGGDVTEVQSYIDARAPITAEVTVAAPLELELNPTIHVVPDTAAVREQVEIQLNDLLLRRAEPGGTLLVSEINEAISLASGETDHTLTVPAANVVADDTELITLGTITWV